jgi:hypothetical protein
MAIRDTKPTDRSGRLARLEAENARLRRLAELADDVIEKAARTAQGRDGAVDVAHRLLAGVPPRD